MAQFRNTGRLSAAGLVVLAVLAIALSVAALMQHRPDAGGSEQVTAVPQDPITTASPEETPDPADPAPTTTEVSTNGPTAESSPPEVSSGLTVLVIGDSSSVGDDSEIWLGEVAAELDWDEAINLSSPGRGFIAQPRACDFDPCAPFGGSIPAIVDAEPDLVITFGGTADGDYGIGDLAASYFDRLRDALPAAELVAISPVTTEETAPFWLSMHNGTIGAAVEAVDGTFIDVGQPGLGDGDELSDEAHAEIAEIVTEELSDLLG